MAAWRDQAAAGVILAFQAGEAAAAAARWTAAELPMVQAVRDEPLGQRQSMESVPMGRRRRYVEVVANRARLLATDLGTVLAGGRAQGHQRGVLQGWSDLGTRSSIDLYASAVVRTASGELPPRIDTVLGQLNAEARLGR